MAEPITTLTDYAIALECLLLAGLLLGQGGVQRLWAAAFGSVSGAAALGGIYHGFAHQMSLAQRIWLWQGMGISVAIASFFTVVAAAMTLRRGRRLALLALATAKLAVAIAVGIALWGFALRVADYLSALIIVLLVQWLQHRPDRAAPAWMIAAIALSGLGAIGLLIPWPRVSPLVVYHLVQMVALFCIYRSATAKHPASASVSS
ncbi:MULTISPECIES: hypothetical protein [Cyanophyceae]|uniref:DUF6962 family protein n=1 Tax=Cyanophyceae TaxID=3028117 RepID=UPI001684F593|nr:MULTISPECIES: hypothetical protein [Cyanophyceae]MBD1915689.1 hypothetical protein [Phormidium sp. FACHB-77]MBD2029062.1 hypothetical protein [Phormidium sp. FACHB-322]MBD2052181.1 hypothetical protein [Leptolyngbya sp. FACHB-60]